MLALFLAAMLGGGGFDCFADPAADYVVDTELTAAGAPELWECERLPSLEESRHWLTVLRHLGNETDRLESVIPNWNAPAIARRRAEIDMAERFYSAVIMARGGGYPSGPWRRKALAEIREMIGEAAWFAGDWPPVPWWQLERHDYSGMDKDPC